MMRKLLLLFIFLFSGTCSQAQDNFNIDDLPGIIIRELNKFRVKNGLDTFEVNDVLINAAAVDAKKFSNSGVAKVDPEKVKKNLVNAGGTKKGEEVTMIAPVSKGRDSYKTAEVAKVIWTRWENNKKDKEILLKAQYMLIGINCVMQKDGKKVVTTAVFGGYDSFNTGAKMKKELAVPYNTKSKKLLTPDAKSCKTCDKWKNYDILQKGLKVENGKIYLEYANLKDLKRLLKKTKDGLAVDIVQRSQYDNPEFNIVDNNFQNKGIMQKIISKDNVFAKNLIKPDPKSKKKEKINKLKIEMGKFNSKINGPYELNLIIIQDGHVCRTVTRTYLEKGDQESSTPVGIIPADSTVGLKPAFEPKSESSILNFVIPFEKNKSEFKPEDIQPFIKALNEPDFMIDGLYIYAYSSIEGDANANSKLQRKRAESVTKVLQSMQQNKITPNIETKDSWVLFELEMEDGKYADVVKLGKEKAIKKINTDGSLLKELEPVFARQRFAQIVLDVTYDITGDKEQKFTSMAFTKALKAKKIAQAYKIMEYAHKQKINKKYSDDVLDSIKIPAEARYSNFFNNKLYYNYLANGSIVDEDDYNEFRKIEKLDATNNVVRFNRIFCSIKLDSTIGTKEQQGKMQQEIDALYKSKISKKLVDGLNIEWQFKIIESLDTIEDADAQIEACINKIKGFYNFKDASWQNALKLAYVFTRGKDYKFSSNVLEPFLKLPDVSEDLLFSYISIASHLPEKFYSRIFSEALQKAKEKNQERYCKLFGEPFMSFQVLDNPNVKKNYKEAACN
jgi:outer membrane protein OmpA-like peptidoglycan-associated protein